MEQANNHDLAVYELIDSGDEAHLDAFLTLYGELMYPYAHYVPRMRQRAQRPADDDPRFLDHYLLFEVDGQPAGITHFRYVPGRDCGLGHDLAVKEPFRRMGVGDYGGMAEYIIATILRTLGEDARRLGRPAPLGLFVEVGTPRLVERYLSYGFVELPVDYHEPILAVQGGNGTERVGGEQRTFKPAQVGIFPAADGHFDPADAGQVTALVLAMLVDHYGLPEDHWAVRLALNSVEAHREGKTGNGS